MGDVRIHRAPRACSWCWEYVAVNARDDTSVIFEIGSGTGVAESDAVDRILAGALSIGDRSYER